MGESIESLQTEVRDLKAKVKTLMMSRPTETATGVAQANQASQSTLTETTVGQSSSSSQGFFTRVSSEGSFRQQAEGAQATQSQEETATEVNDQPQTDTAGQSTETVRADATQNSTLLNSFMKRAFG